MAINLTFVIGVRHPDNASDWNLTKKYLTQALASISAQTSNAWQCIVVANTGSDLPPMPEKCKVCYVDFPPNPLQGDIEDESHWEAYRLDHGLKLLTGMLFAGKTDYFMLVDDDDLVSNRISEFVSNNLGSNGWYVQKGYIWGDGGSLVMKNYRFNRHCGTSHIIRSDLYSIPDRIENADIEYVKAMIGDHNKIDHALKINGTPLSPLPFYGAIYRTGHGNSFSKRLGLIRYFFLRKYVFRHPKFLLKSIMNLRILTNSIKKEFFGWYKEINI